MKSNVLKSEGFLSEYIAYGSGEPTIVLESGLGDGLKIWSAVINELKNVTRTFSYNRAGYGKSSSMHKNRNGCVIVEESHSLLHELNYRPPYILVGHSLGGAYMEIFAQKHPKEVCGLVLIDPMAIEMDESMQERPYYGMGSGSPV